MAEVHYCDICGEILLKEVYILSVVKIEADSYTKKYDITNTSDILSAIQRQKKELKEICPNCKKVLEYVFSLRISKLKVLKKELENIYRQPSKEPKKIIELPKRKKNDEKDGK